MKIINSDMVFLDKSVRAAKLPKDRNIFDKPDSEMSKDTLWKLAKAKNGSGHDCALKGIHLNMVIEAKEKFWKQWERYHFQDTISSSSSMHKILQQDLDEVLPDSIYWETKKRLEMDIKYLKANWGILTEEERKQRFESITDNLPMGYLYIKNVELNALQLKTMISQRKNHKLTAWHEFIEKTLENHEVLKSLLGVDDYGNSLK